MDAAYERYFAFLEELGRTLDSLTALAQEKTKAVLKDDLMAVNECLKKEQALSLQLRGLDAKRERVLSALGLGGTPLSAFARKCAPEWRIKARAAEEKLRTQFALYQGASQAARSTLECNIHQIEKYMAEDKGLPQTGSMADIRA